MISQETADQYHAEATALLGDMLNGYKLEADPVAMGLLITVTDEETRKSIKRVLTKSQIDQHRLNAVETAARVSIKELQGGLGF